jgi:hypothetical protein
MQNRVFNQFMWNNMQRLTTIFNNKLQTKISNTTYKIEYLTGIYME